MMINAGVNVKNWLRKEYVIRDLFGILVNVNMNAINHVMLLWSYENCKCRKKLVDKLVEECTENIDEVKIAEMTLFDRRNECKFLCTIYVVLIEIVFTISIGIGTYFTKKFASKYDYVYQTSNY